MHRADSRPAALAGTLCALRSGCRSCTTLAGYPMHRRNRLHVNGHCDETPMALALAKSFVMAVRSLQMHRGIGMSSVYEGVLVRRVS